MKFLLDENVRVELYTFLSEQKGVDVAHVARGASDATVLRQSHMEQRIIVTNDSDFAKASPKDAYAVVWLRIPQRDSKALITSFQLLIIKCNIHEGALIMLYDNNWNVDILKSKTEKCGL